MEIANSYNPRVSEMTMNKRNLKKINPQVNERTKTNLNKNENYHKVLPFSTPNQTVLRTIFHVGLTWPEQLFFPFWNQGKHDGDETEEILIPPNP